MSGDGKGDRVSSGQTGLGGGDVAAEWEVKKNYLASGTCSVPVVFLPSYEWCVCVVCVRCG